MRIVSLVPSATEHLYACGAGDLLVGRSHECDFPLKARGVPVLTGARTRFESSAQVDRDVKAVLGAEGGGQSLYTLNADLLARLAPDVILTQDLCSVCSIDVGTVRRIAENLPRRPEIVSLNPATFEGVLDDLLTVGKAVGHERQALEAVVRLRERVSRAEDYVNPFVTGPRVAVLEWTDPLFIAGHWTPQLVERAGGSHPLNPTRAAEGSGAAAGPIGETMRAAGKSIEVSVDALVASRPEVVIIAPCGLDLERTRSEAETLVRQPWFGDLPAAKSGRVAIVDGNQMFSRPGPRLVDAFEFLVGFLNDRPEVIPVGFPWESVR